MSKEEQKQNRIHNRLNTQIEKYKDQYCTYIDKDEKTHQLPIEYAIYKNRPKNIEELDNQEEEIMFKYCLIPDASNFPYFAWLFDYIKIKPCEKNEFWVQNQLTEKWYRPNIYEFLTNYNTGTYLVAYDLDRESHFCRYDVIHNGKILDNTYEERFTNLKNIQDIKHKEEEIKSLRKQFNAKVVDVVKIREPHPSIVFNN